MALFVKGKLIVIEGLDGSGKETQARLLKKHLKCKGLAVTGISFPDYEKPSSTLVKMLLNGDFQKSSCGLSPYVSSSFFSVDRVASYLQYWSNEYLSGNVIIADRYTTSNEIYQTIDLSPEHKYNFIEWLEDFEYNKLGLPSPDLVIYLDMLPHLSQKLMDIRYDGDPSKKDIYERDIDFLIKCRTSALHCVSNLNWKLINCFESDSIRDVDSIHKDVRAFVDDFLNISN